MTGKRGVRLALVSVGLGALLGGCSSGSVASAHAHVAATSAMASAPSTSGAAIDDATRRRLWALALQVAKQNNGAVAHADAVRSTRQAAERVLSGAGVDSDQPVWVVQVEGTASFSCGVCRHPSGSNPTGTYITVVIDASSLQELDFGIRATEADLAALGPVVTLRG